MGIRMTQWVGLNNRALDYVKGEKILSYQKEEKRIYPDGTVEILPIEDVYTSSVKVEDSGKCAMGMFEDEKIPLKKFVFPNGYVVYEKEQTIPWSSGPIIFTALHDERGKWIKSTLWTSAEIEEYL